MPGGNGLQVVDLRPQRVYEGGVAQATTADHCYGHAHSSVGELRRLLLRTLTLRRTRCRFSGTPLDLGEVAVGDSQLAVLTRTWRGSLQNSSLYQRTGTLPNALALSACRFERRQCSSHRLVSESQRLIAHVAQDLRIDKQALHRRVRQDEAGSSRRRGPLTREEREELKRRRRLVGLGIRDSRPGRLSGAPCSVSTRSAAQCRSFVRIRPCVPRVRSWTRPSLKTTRGSLLRPPAPVSLSWI